VEYALTTMVFMTACLAGGIVAANGDPAKANRGIILCALGAIGFGAGAAAGATAFSLKLLIAAAATGGAAGGAF